MSGGAKKQTVGYAYALGMHLVLCHGPIDKVIEIQADEKTAYTDANWTGGIRYVSAMELFGGIDREGGIAGNFNLLMGGPSQGVDGYLNARLSPGNPIPAYRGVTSMVLQQVYIGNSVYVKKLAFKASRIHVRTTDGITQWYDEKAEIPTEVSGAALVLSLGGALNSIMWFQNAITDDWGPNYAILPSPNQFSWVLNLGDRYWICAVNGQNYTTVDGINYIARTSISEPDGVYHAIFDATLGMIICAGDYGRVHYSLDKGATWLIAPIETGYYDAPITHYRIIKCGAIYISSFNSDGRWYTTSNIVAGVWTDNGANTIGNECGANVSTAMVAGNSGSYPIIHQTTDGATFLAETLPIGLRYDMTLNAPVYGFDRWACVGHYYDFDESSTYRSIVLYKVASAWTIGYSSDVDVQITGFSFIKENGVFVMTTTEETLYSPNLTDWTNEVNWDVPPATRGKYYFSGIFGTGASSDMNPAHIIRECLTDPDWGMGYLDSDIDDDSFMYAADVLYGELFGMSLLWNSQTTIEDFVKEVLKHIDAALFVDRKTGKFKLKLIRDDYELGSLISLNPSNVSKISDFTRPTFGELTNSLTVKFWNSQTNKDDSVTVQDIALAQMQNSVINTTITYAGITKANLATRIAQRDLTTISTPIVSCTLYCDRTAAPLDIGDAFLFTWPDYQIEDVVMRVAAIAFGNGNQNQVRVSCTQDVYSTPEVPIIVPPSGEWTDVTQPPLPAVDRIPYELPYIEAIQQYGQTAVDTQLVANPEIGYVGLALGRPTSDSINANLYVNSGGGYVFRDTVDFSPSCKLAENVGKTDTSFNVSDANRIADAAAGSWLQIGTELVAFDSFLDPVLTVRRGLLDTVPQDHATGTLALFWDNYPANDPTQYSEGETLLLKATTITLGGELALGDAEIDSVTMNSRMIRPYPPGQFKINGVYYPTSVIDGEPISVTWAHRDRLLQTGGFYLDTTAGSIGPEPGTTYTIRYYDDDTDILLDTESGITGTTGADFTPSGDFNIRVELESVRDGFTSWQTHSHVFEWFAELSNDGAIDWTEENDIFELTGTNAGSSSDGRITENGDHRITEDNNNRIPE